MLKLYDFLPSGNGHKVRLTLKYLGLDYDLIELDLEKMETRTEEFRKLNPNQKIPTLVLEDGAPLFESNAIIFYLAEGTDLLPADKLDRARVLQWMFFEQYSHEPFIAVARSWSMGFKGGLNEEHLALLPEKMEGGYRALDIMENHLKDKNYFVGDNLTIADIALYAYTHVAEEGGFNLGNYPYVQSWLGRVATMKGYAPITDC